MKRSLLAAALLAATATTALAASVNNIVTLRTAGYWNAWYSPANSSGRALCGMGDNLRDSDGARGSFMVKYTAGAAHIFVHVWKTSWSIPSGTQIPVWLQFDNDTPLTTTAAGGPGEDKGGNGGFIEFTIKEDFTKEFMDLFAAAAQMTIGFRGGSEQPWTVNMTGSREVADSFRKCVVALSQTPGTTQPYGNSGNSQPYGSAPAKPSQPFGNAKPAPAWPPTGKPAKKDDGSV